MGPTVSSNPIDPFSVQTEVLEAKGREDLEQCILQLHLSAPPLKRDTGCEFMKMENRPQIDQQALIQSHIIRADHPFAASEISSSHLQPPQPGWLASISTSILGMQQSKHHHGLQATHYFPEDMGYAPAEGSRPPQGHTDRPGLTMCRDLSSVNKADPNRQAAKRLKHILGDSFFKPSGSEVHPTLSPHGGSTAGDTGVHASSCPPEIHPSWKLFDEEPPPACLLTPDAATTAVHFLGTGCAEPSKYR